MRPLGKGKAGSAVDTGVLNQNQEKLALLMDVIGVSFDLLYDENGEKAPITWKISRDKDSIFLLAKTISLGEKPVKISSPCHDNPSPLHRFMCRQLQLLFQPVQQRYFLSHSSCSNGDGMTCDSSRTIGMKKKVWLRLSFSLHRRCSSLVQRSTRMPFCSIQL